MDAPGGEPTTRLDRLESDLAEIKGKVSNLETEFEKAKGERTQMLYLINGTSDEPGLIQKTNKIYSYIDGTEKVAGFALKHWRTLLKFGCGFVTAWGVSNPHLAASLGFVSRFFGFN